MGTFGRKGIIAATCGLFLLVAWIFLRGRGTPAISERQLATRTLAEYLKSSLKPKAVLVISNPFSQMPNRPAQVYDFEKAGIAGLQEGFGAAVPLKIAFPKLKPEAIADPSSVPVDPKTTTPLSFLVTDPSFDEVLKANPDCDTAISLIGLPVNLRAMEAWTRPGAPRFALLLPDWRIIGDTRAIQDAFASGKLVAAVIAKPGSPAQNRPLTDSRKAFAERYLLITSNNLADSLKQFPTVFSP